MNLSFGRHLGTKYTDAANIAQALKIKLPEEVLLQTFEVTLSRDISIEPWLLLSYRCLPKVLRTRKKFIGFESFKLYGALWDLHVGESMPFLANVSWKELRYPTISEEIDLLVPSIQHLVVARLSWTKKQEFNLSLERRVS